MHVKCPCVGLGFLCQSPYNIYMLAPIAPGRGVVGHHIDRCIIIRIQASLTSIDDNESVNITNCYFRGNIAILGNFSGGAINVNQGKVIRISNSYFIDNNVAIKSNYSGNALYMGRGDMTIVDNFFCNKYPKSDYTIILH